MSRTTQSFSRGIATAFDFDVVTDTPVRRPIAAEPKQNRPEPKPAQPEAPQRSGGVTSEAAE